MDHTCQQPPEIVEHIENIASQIAPESDHDYVILDHETIRHVTGALEHCDTCTDLLPEEPGTTTKSVAIILTSSASDSYIGISQSPLAHLIPAWERDHMDLTCTDGAIIFSEQVAEDYPSIYRDVALEVHKNCIRIAMEHTCLSSSPARISHTARVYTNTIPEKLQDRINHTIGLRTHIIGSWAGCDGCSNEIFKRGWSVCYDAHIANMFLAYTKNLDGVYDTENMYTLLADDFDTYFNDDLEKSIQQLLVSPVGFWPLHHSVVELIRDNIDRL